MSAVCKHTQSVVFVLASQTDKDKYVFTSFDCVSESIIAGSYENSLTFWKTIELFCSMSAPLWHFHQQYNRVPVFQNALQPLYWLSLMISFLVDVTWYLRCGFHVRFLNDYYCIVSFHVFLDVCVWHVCSVLKWIFFEMIFSFLKYLSFYLWTIKNSLHVLDTRPCKE